MDTCISSASPKQADLAILNGRVVTIDKENPHAEAVATRGEIIVSVGTNDSICRLIQDGVTEVIDARGRLVIPGFNDAHAHFYPVKPGYVKLDNVADASEMAEKLKQQVALSRPGQLITGGRWNHELFSRPEWPTKELIDAVSPDNPVILKRIDGHTVLANTCVIEKAGITAKTPSPPGGEIMRNPSTGEPTGIFKESAIALLGYDKTDENRTGNGAPQGYRMARELGVTSVQIPGAADWPVYESMLQNNEMTTRIDIGDALTCDIGRLKNYQGLIEKYPRSGNWLRFGYLKAFLDGTLGSSTAMFFEPYNGEPENTGTCRISYEELESEVLAADSMGFQIGVHAIGPKANHWVLNMFEKAIKQNGRRNSRHRIEHAQILAESDIPRFAALGVVPSMQPTHCITDKSYIVNRIGAERSRCSYAWKSLLDARAKLAFGSDYVVEPLNPMEGLYAAVTRKDRMGGEGDGWIPRERLSMEEAIRCYTHGSAYAQFMEDRKGMIKSGYLADLVITDRDLLSIPENEIMKTRVVYTITGGKVVFRGNDR